MTWENRDLTLITVTTVFVIMKLRLQMTNFFIVSTLKHFGRICKTYYIKFYSHLSLVISSSVPFM